MLVWPFIQSVTVFPRIEAGHYVQARPGIPASGPASLRQQMLRGYVRENTVTTLYCAAHIAAQFGLLTADTSLRYFVL